MSCVLKCFNNFGFTTCHHSHDLPTICSRCIITTFVLYFSCGLDLIHFSLNPKLNPEILLSFTRTKTIKICYVVINRKSIYPTIWLVRTNLSILLANEEKSIPSEMLCRHNENPNLIRADKSRSFTEVLPLNSSDRNCDVVAKFSIVLT